MSKLALVYSQFNKLAFCCAKLQLNLICIKLKSVTETFETTPGDRCDGLFYQNVGDFSIKMASEENMLSVYQVEVAALAEKSYKILF